MLAASMFHVCGLYVSCLRPLSTTHGYDKGRIAFWGARKRLGALAVLCGFERRACKTTGLGGGLETSGLGSCFWGSCFSVVLSWFVLFGRAFRGSFFLVVLFVVRSSGSCFWSFFLWFVLLVRAFGGSYVFFVRCFKILRGVCGKVRGFLMQR